MISLVCGAGQQVDQPGRSRDCGARQQTVPIDQPGRSRDCGARQQAVPVDQPGRSRGRVAWQQAARQQSVPGDHLHL